mgnify:CR=1 FL=1
MKSSVLEIGAWLLVLVIVLALAFSIQPFTSKIDAERTLVDEVGAYKPKNCRLTDATYLVAVLTPMSNVSTDMVRW